MEFASVNLELSPNRVCSRTACAKLGLSWQEACLIIEPACPCPSLVQGLCPQIIAVELIDTKSGTASLVHREHEFPCSCSETDTSPLAMDGNGDMNDGGNKPGGRSRGKRVGRGGRGGARGPLRPTSARATQAGEAELDGSKGMGGTAKKRGLGAYERADPENSSNGRVLYSFDPEGSEETTYSQVAKEPGSATGVNGSREWRMGSVSKHVRTSASNRKGGRRSKAGSPTNIGDIGGVGMRPPATNYSLEGLGGIADLPMNVEENLGVPTAKRAKGNGNIENRLSDGELQIGEDVVMDAEGVLMDVELGPDGQPIGPGQESFFEELAGSMNSRELKGLGNGQIIMGKRRHRN